MTKFKILPEIISKLKEDITQIQGVIPLEYVDAHEQPLPYYSFSFGIERFQNYPHKIEAIVIQRGTWRKYLNAPQSLEWGEPNFKMRELRDQDAESFIREKDYWDIQPQFKNIKQLKEIISLCLHALMNYRGAIVDQLPILQGLRSALEDRAKLPKLRAKKAELEHDLATHERLIQYTLETLALYDIPEAEGTFSFSPKRKGGVSK